ncbi:MAG: hypothetical protein A2176_03440 [Spirochaetes bacterium RBG_13_51_14]|nr:MAG: hypothetical protein A2176_03440 [Spirochaetes bacterium RBG_13_51_14]
MSDGSADKLRESREKAYNRIKLRLTITDIILNGVIIAVLAFSGISPLLVNTLAGYISSDYLIFFAFITTVGIIYTIINVPFDFYGGYIVEHRFNLSNQTFPAWLFEKIKGAAVGIVISVPVALAFYFFLKATGWFWWIYFSTVVFLVSVFIARVAPVIIFPLFYKFKELESDEIKLKIESLLGRQDITIRGIYAFNLSKDTKKANAGFTGIGRSKRVIISDTLIEHFTTNEIAVVFAHEMGHYQKRHIVKSILIGAAGVYLSFFLCNQIYRLTLGSLGFHNAYDIAAVPVLFFYLTLVSLITMPLSNALSRKYEREADRYALEITGDRDSFISSMEKLADMNLADRDPNPVTEFMFYSHPSIKKRIEFARKWEL